MDMKYYIGCSADTNIRYHSSSGGVGTAIIKYLLETGEYGTAMSFFFDKEKCQYGIKLIYDYSDYNNCGSVYQDTDTISFIKNNILNIKEGIIVTCLPCQVKPIRTILARNKVKHFIISLCCSGQTTVQGTWFYYKLLGIKKNDVNCIQYRGNGWPSGIQIELNDGSIIRKENYTYPWTLMHESMLFRPKRCLSCTIKTSEMADVSLADPWLKEFIQNDKTGHSVIICNEIGDAIIKEMHDKDLLTYSVIDKDTYIKSQLGTIQTKAKSNQYRRFNKMLGKMGEEKSLYKRIVTSSVLFVKIHTQLMLLFRRMSKIISIFKNAKLQYFLRWKYWSRKFGGTKGFVKLGKNLIIENPKCIFWGESTGVGDGTFFGPIIEFLGEKYTPKIEIGDGTWIGKNCSIAAIHGVTIGKEVLFAGHVHITDHSHGYELPDVQISKQKLISKGPVVIGDQCWLGFNCEILSGVHIGRHSVVAARAVVTKDVPDYCIVAGNPAKVIKQYNPETRTWERIKR